jgi:uncharacterized protein DUF6801
MASVAAAGAVVALSGVVAGPASASDAGENGVYVSKDLTYSCEFPIIGPQDVTGTVSVDLPTSAGTGERIQPNNFKIDVTLSANIVQAFRLIGAKTVEADAWADVDVAFGGRSLTFGVPNLHAPKQEIPASGTMSFSITGPMPSFILNTAGTLELAAGQVFHADVTALDANGQPTGLGNPIPVDCQQKPGQDPSLGAIAITGAQQPASTVGGGVTTMGAVDKQLTYSCEFPVIGQDNVDGRVRATFPDAVPVNERVTITDAVVDATFSQRAADAVRAAHATTADGDGQVDLHASYTDANGSLEITLGLPVIIPSVDIPAEGPMTFTLPITAPNIIFRAPGELSVAAGALNGNLTPRLADGSPTELGTFPVPCSPVAGQDLHLGSVQITG